MFVHLNIIIMAPQPLIIYNFLEGATYDILPSVYFFFSLINLTFIWVSYPANTFLHCHMPLQGSNQCICKLEVMGQLTLIACYI